MKLLILDFLRRWWWLLAMLVLLSFSTTIGGYPFALGPAAMICLLFDAGRGVFRVVRPLPVTRREQALTWWILGVLLVPLISIAPIVVGTIIHQAAHVASSAPILAPPEVVAPGTSAPRIIAYMQTYSPWFAAGIHIWITLGVAGLCFLLACALPTRPPEGIWETLIAMFAGAVWGLSIPGMTILLPMFPRTPSALLPGHWALLASVPLWVVLSYFAAPDLVRRRMFPLKPGTSRPAQTRTSNERPDTLRGVPLFLTTFVGRSAIVVLSIILFQTAFCHWLYGGRKAADDPFIVIQAIGFAILFSAIGGEANTLRTLRMLPISTAQLATLLMAVPLGNALIVSVITAGWSGLGDPGSPWLLNFAAQFFAITGCGALCLAAMLHIASSARLLVVFGFWLPAVAISFSARMPVLLALAGAIGTLGAWHWLRRGLRKSNSFYQARRFFGVSIGQPSTQC